jgi:hypothetical protein
MEGKERARVGENGGGVKEGEEARSPCHSEGMARRDE